MRSVTPIIATALVALIATLRPDVASGQGHIVVEQNVIYGQVAGSALMADVAYPVSEDLIPAVIYVHGGRWRAGERTGRDRLDVYEWATKGFFSMTIGPSLSSKPTTWSRRWRPPTRRIGSCTTPTAGTCESPTRSAPKRWRSSRTLRGASEWRPGRAQRRGCSRAT